MLKDYFRLALHSVRQRKMRSWLTLLGIFIGIAAVVALISLSQGLESAIKEQFVKLGSDKVIVQAIGSGYGPPGSGAVAPLTKSDLDEIKKVKGVDQAFGRLIRSVKVQFDKEIEYTYAVSVPDDNEDLQLVIEVNNYELEQGRMLKKEDKYKAVLGKDLATDLFGKEVQLQDTLEIEGKEFKVVGLLKKSGNPQQDVALVVPEAALEEILGIEGTKDMIAVKVNPGEELSTVSERLKKELRNHRKVKEGKEDFSVETPENILATLTTILAIVQGILVGIAAISLLVGGIGIMNTMYTAVLERTKEIGIMKATGARNSQIWFLFLTESGLLGLLGGIIGVSLGLGISKTVEYVAYQIYEAYLIRADISWILILSMLLFAFAIGAISGALPARQAAKLKPVDALRM
ncbi:MAG TPA: ABC transporter permease [Candidatus Nanoarchaeia archaeon]|nr:ABC transporter permease [Candidatus Nanoarchaeia archaeon]